MKEHPVPPQEVRRHNVAEKIVTRVIFTIVFIIGCSYFTLAIIFNGGLGGLISNLKPAPNPNSSAMNARREAVTAEINQSFEDLQNILHYNYYETATHDYCSRGDNNYKRSDGYAYRCSLNNKILRIQWQLSPTNDQLRAENYWYWLESPII
ncbi:MAG: hypothetical protein IPN58_11740 [Anaerolineales bacterium]|nr:hypothetical protein [Anaerolineales bacterium]